MKCYAMVFAFVSFISINLIASLHNSELDQKRKSSLSRPLIAATTALQMNNKKAKWQFFNNFPISLSDKAWETYKVQNKIDSLLRDMGESPMVSDQVSTIIVKYVFDHKECDIEDQYSDQPYDSRDDIRCMTQMVYHNKPVIIAGSAQGNIFAFDPYNGKIYTKQVYRQSSMRSDCIVDLAFSQKHNLLIVVLSDCVDLCRVDNDTLNISLSKTIQQELYGLRCVALAPDEMSFATGGSSTGKTSIWTLPDCLLRDSYENSASRLSWNHDSTLLFSINHPLVPAEQNTLIRKNAVDTYDMVAGAVIRTYSKIGLHNVMACSPVKNEAVLHREFGGLFLIDFSIGKIGISLQATKNLCESHNRVAWSPSGRYIASMSNSPVNQVNIWNALTGKLIAQFSGSDRWGALCFVSDTMLAASADTNGKVLVFTRDEA